MDYRCCSIRARSRLRFGFNAKRRSKSCAKRWVRWIEQSLVRRRTDSSRGELDVKSGGRSRIYLASPAELRKLSRAGRPIHLQILPRHFLATFRSGFDKI